MIQDLRYALRTLRADRGFTLAIVATIALGIGANTAIFTVLNGIVLRPLPFPDSERVVILSETHPSAGDYWIASPPNVADWAAASRTIETFGLARGYPFTMRTEEGLISVQGGIATPGWFDIHAIEAARGRLLREEDLLEGNNRVAILSHAYWTKRFGASEETVGASIMMDGEPYTVIGILPPDVWIHRLGYVQVWRPLTSVSDDVFLRSWRGFTALGRLAPGATLEQARQEMEGIRAGLAERYPDTNGDWGLRIAPLRERVSAPVRSTLIIFLGAVGFVLLIGCSNVANLMLVRATGRSREFAVRASLGAGRTRMVRQVLTESLLLSILGGVMGLLVASWGTRVFLALAPGDIPRLGEIGVDGGVLGFTLLLIVVTAGLFGLPPALQASRTDLTRVMGSARSTDRSGHRLRGILVAGELALALMLLMGAGLMTRGFARLLRWEPGFDTSGIHTVWALAPFDKFDDGQSITEMFDRVAAAIRALPEIEAVGQTSAGPLFGGLERSPFRLEGRPLVDEALPSVRWYDIAPDYFPALGVPILRGRGITGADRAGTEPVAVINETMAARYWPGGDPIGARLTIRGSTMRIVGIVQDIRPFKPDRPVMPEIYWPKRQHPRGATYYLVRARGEVPGLQRLIKERATTVEPALQLSGFMPMEEIVDRRLISPRFNMLLVVLFAALAVVLAAVGTYGVLACTVVRRRRDIAIRIAVGACPGRIVREVVGYGMRLALIGLVAGSAGALALTRVLTSLLHGLSPTDPATYMAVTLLFGAVAICASWLPARRAAATDPMVSLRME